MESNRKAFTVFCDETKLMPRENLVKALRSIGCIVEEEFIANCEKTHLDINEFMKLASQAEVHGLDRKKIEEAFAFYDPQETGYIKAADFKRILSTGSDSLSESDINIVLEAFPPNDQGKICYSLPINFMFESNE
ncbi:Calcium ion binding [Glugoides intestinalis]